MTPKSISDTLVNEYVTVLLRDRKETVYNGTVLEISKYSVTLKLKEHGNEYLEHIPMGNISVISHKLLGIKSKNVRKVGQKKSEVPAT